MGFFSKWPSFRDGPRFEATFAKYTGGHIFVKTMIIAGILLKTFSI